MARIVFIKAFTCFAFSKFYGSIFHGLFHIFTHVGMDDLWRSFQSDKLSMEWDATSDNWLAEAVALTLTWIWFSSAVRMYGNRWKYFDRFIVSIYYSLQNITCFVWYTLPMLCNGNVKTIINAFFQRIPFMQWPWFLQYQIVSELSYYMAYTLVELYDGEGILILHHLLTVGIIGIGARMGYTHFLVLSLFVLTPTNTPLTFCKWMRQRGRNDLAVPVFGIFAILFALLRLGGHLGIILTLIQGFGRPNVPYSACIVCNAIMFSLYGIQWFWFRKIMHILRIKK
mgnify:CR=1 FL=1